jgi:hypothetical protein
VRETKRSEAYILIEKQEVFSVNSPLSTPLIPEFYINTILIFLRLPDDHGFGGKKAYFCNAV